MYTVLGKTTYAYRKKKKETDKNHSSNYTKTARIMSNCPRHFSSVGFQRTLLFHRVI